MGANDDGAPREALWRAVVRFLGLSEAEDGDVDDDSWLGRLEWEKRFVRVLAHFAAYAAFALSLPLLLLALSLSKRVPLAMDILLVVAAIAWARGSIASIEALKDRQRRHVARRE